MLRFEGESLLPGSPEVNASRLKDATFLVKLPARLGENNLR